MLCDGNCSECFEAKEGNCRPILTKEEKLEQFKEELEDFLGGMDLLPEYYDFMGEI